MKYDTLIKEFTIEFPEFEDAYEEEIEWSESLPHVFFGDVLNPFLEEELTTMKNKKLLNRIFEFLEKMATSEDEKVQEVAGVTVLESLGDDKKILKKARSLMQSNTLKMSHEIERGWGRE